MSADNDKRCIVCGAPLPPRKRLYCSHECNRKHDYDRAKANYTPTGKERSVYTHKICADCGIVYRGHIRSYRCPSCQAEADRRHDIEAKRRKASGTARQIGSTAYCTVCNRPYIVRSGRQMYCLDCKATATLDVKHQQSAAWNRSARKDPRKRAEINTRARIKEPAERICKECGKPFRIIGPGMFCCTDCQSTYKHRYMQEYDAKRREAHIERMRKRRESLAPEQREEINRKAREAYARRMQQKEPEH